MVEIAGARQPQVEGEDHRKMSGYFAVLLDSDNEDGPSTQNKDAKAKGKKDVAPAGIFMNDYYEKDFYVETMLNIANISE